MWVIQRESSVKYILERTHQAQGLMESCGSYRESLQSNIREKTPGTEVDGELWVIQRESSVKYKSEDNRHRG